MLGAAGGDGTQALVATVAVEHDLPFVCIPAGTRNHFALDLGVDRDDVVGSLDAFVDGVEQRVDLGIVADRVFVNNVSLGVYGEIVQSDEYRDAKVKTTVDRLPTCSGPTATRPSCGSSAPTARPRATHQLVLISNNPYELRRLGGFGTRERMDTGCSGITTISVASTAEAAQLTALGLAGQLDRFGGYDTWTAATIEIEADVPVATGIDGEFVRLDPPVRFSIRPACLRVRLARHAPQASPAAAACGRTRATVRVLWNLAAHGTPAGS